MVILCNFLFRLLKYTKAITTIELRIVMIINGLKAPVLTVVACVVGVIFEAIAIISVGFGVFDTVFVVVVVVTVLVIES